MQNDIILTEDHKRLYMNSISMAFRNMRYFRDNNVPGVRIYDRLHLSEVVYGNKYRGYNTDHIYDIESEFLEDINYDNVYLILLVDEVDNLIARDDGEGFTSDPSEINKEVKAFTNSYYDSNIIRKKMININGKDIKTVFEEILKQIGEA